MSLSGTTDFAMTGAEIIEDAYLILGVGDEGETLTTFQTTRALRALNAMLKAWQAKGVNLWKLQEGTLSLVADQQSYSMYSGGDFTTRPLQILSCRLYKSSLETPMIRVPREDYFNLPDKSSSGIPTQYYYDPGRVQGTLYIWPVDDGTNSLKFTYLDTVDDLDTSANNPDAPQEWYETIIYNLARRLSPRVGIPMRAEDLQFAIQSEQELLGWDQEPDETVFVFHA